MMIQESFYETQRFNKWWHYMIAGIPAFITAFIFLLVWIKEDRVQNEPSALIGMAGTLFLMALVFIWFLLLKLETHINQNGISINYMWIPFCKRHIPWSEIKDISVIDYSPLSDYGGWGVRYSLSGNGWCYNVAGDKGIKLFYQNGKPFLIGTQQAEEAKAIIAHYFKH